MIFAKNKITMNKNTHNSHMANNNETQTCLITLESRQEIEDRGGYIFDAGQQIYDLEKLSDWLTLHKTYPHAMTPTSLELCELRSLNRIYLNRKFVYVTDAAVSPAYFQQKFPPVSRLQDIDVTDDEGNVLLDDISRIFAVGKSLRRFCSRPQRSSLYHYTRP
jgi:hypothetical protein